MNLHYGIEYKREGAYGTAYWTKYVPIEKMVSFYLVNLINDEENISYAFITATLGRRNWFRKHDTHLMVLDCDSDNDMLAACHWLKTETRTQFDLIHSSPGRYWIVTDVIGAWKDVWGIFNQIPGVCNNYRNKYCKKYRRMNLRAFPKIYNGRPTKPIFPIEFNTGPLAQEFITSLQKYFDSEHYEKLMKAVFLHYHLKKKTMAEIAADPGFQL